MLKDNNKIFIIQTILFIALSKVLLCIAFVICLCIHVFLILKPMDNILLYYIQDTYKATDIEFYTSICILIIISPLIAWLCTKFLGYFKTLDRLKLNLFLKFVIIIIVTIITFCCLYFIVPIDDEDLKIIFASLILPLPISFALFKLAQKLTPKYKFLQKFGYIFSIEFLIDIIKKLKNVIIKI